MSDRQGRSSRRPENKSGDLDLAVRSIHRIFKSADLFSRRALRDFGVSGPQIWALRTLAAAGTLAAGELAAQLHLHPSTVTGILKRLESRGLVTRAREAGDRRVSRLTLTARGKNLVFRAPEPPRSRVLRALSRLSAADLFETRRSLQRVERAMRGANVEGED